MVVVEPTVGTVMIHHRTTTGTGVGAMVRMLIIGARVDTAERAAVAPIGRSQAMGTGVTGRKTAPDIKSGSVSESIQAIGAATGDVQVQGQVQIQAGREDMVLLQVVVKHYQKVQRKVAIQVDLEGEDI